MDRDELKNREERKRAAAYLPAERWLHIQRTITWAEANLPPHLRRNRPRQPAPWFEVSRPPASGSAPDLPPSPSG